MVTPNASFSILVDSREQAPDRFEREFGRG